MSPHPRSARNRGLPAGLRERAGYYSWKDPRTGKEHGLGRDRGQAIRDANEANALVAGDQQRSRLVDRLDGSDGRTIKALADLFAAELAKRRLADNTRRTYKSMLARIRADLGENTIVARVTTLQVVEVLTALRDAGKERQAQALRSFMKDFFRAGIAAGWMTANPVLVTAAPSVEVKRARLTLDVFLQVRDKADGWLVNAMNLALVSAQRREDVASARVADVRDDAWWCEQSKTGQRLRIPLALRLDALGLSLGEVVRACRSTGVLSRFLIHQTVNRGNSPVGRRIWVDTITRRFSDVLATLSVDFGDRTPPTFHEIRSLAERLYKAQGNVDTQELLGHRDPRSTATYHDARGAEWVSVKIA